VFYTYIVASKRNGTLYAGSTDSITKRTYEHREKLRPGFTAKYSVSILDGVSPMRPGKAPFAESDRSRNGDGHGSCA
jgi:putative endonuclease